MRKSYWIVGTLLPIVSVGPAYAQDASGSGTINAESGNAAVSVADRPRPDYSPIGGRVGSFFVYPRIDATASYNSNLRATTSNELSDFVFEVRPSVQIQSNWSRNLLDAQLYYQRDFHAKYGSEDYSQYGAVVDGRVDLDSTTAITLTGNVGKLTEPRTDINSPNGNGINSTTTTRSPVSFGNYGLSAVVRHDFVHSSVIASADVNKQSFDDAVLLDGTPFSQSYRDNLTYNGSLEGRLQVGAGTSAILRVGASSISYDQNPFNGFDRNSTAYRAEAGLGLALTNLIHGDILVGYFKQNNNDPRFVDGGGISFSGNILYSPTPRTSVRLRLDRSIEPGGSTVTSGNIRSTVSVTVDHELLPNLVVTGYGRYASIEPQGITGSASEYEGRASLLYYMNRRFRYTLGLSQYVRRSDIYSNFNVTSVSGGVIVTF